MSYLANAPVSLEEDLLREVNLDLPDDGVEGLDPDCDDDIF